MMKGMNYDEKHMKDFQPPKKQCAGVEMGRANDYMERKDRQLNKEAADIRSQAFKGRYQ